MIIVKRGAEPPRLATSRARNLPIAEALWRASGRVTDTIRDLLDTGYQVGGVKKALFEAQHKKCAYCEVRPGFDENPIEHFRPKKLALRHLPKTGKTGRLVDTERYWWLAWSWENLLFSCHRCNGASKKGNFFPLEPGSAPLPTLSKRLDLERPSLLDPSDDGLRVTDHLAWRPLDTSVYISRWSWGIDVRSPRGEATMAILELDYRADDVTDRYRQTVWPRFHDLVLKHLKTDDVRLAHTAWAALQRDLLHPKNDLVFATWCMLEVLRTRVPEARAARLPQDPL